VGACPVFGHSVDNSHIANLKHVIDIVILDEKLFSGFDDKGLKLIKKL
jgi:hypothetical protein